MRVLQGAGRPLYRIRRVSLFTLYCGSLQQPAEQLFLGRPRRPDERVRLGFDAELGHTLIEQVRLRSQFFGLCHHLSGRP